MGRPNIMLLQDVRVGIDAIGEDEEGNKLIWVLDSDAGCEWHIPIPDGLASLLSANLARPNAELRALVESEKAAAENAVEREAIDRPGA